MNDYNSDQAKELRRARLLKVKPKAAPMMLTESEFNREYTEYRFVSIEHLTNLEEANNVMFCPACAKDVNTAMGKRRVLHISYEDDPLGNFPLIAVAKCQGCEWEEMIPVVKQELSQDEQTLLRRFHRAALKTRGFGGVTSSVPDPRASPFDQSVWANEMKRYSEPGQIAPMRPGQNIEFMPPDKIRFGQGKADRVWGELAKSNEDHRDLELATKQYDMIEHFEAEERAKTQARAYSKSATFGMAYGMGQSRIQDIQRQYNDALGQQMAKQIDANIMRQMQNYSFSDDEIAQIKKEPAEAAKAAHKVLIDKVKKRVGK